MSTIKITPSHVMLTIRITPSQATEEQKTFAPRNRLWTRNRLRLLGWAGDILLGHLAFPKELAHGLIHAIAGATESGMSVALIGYQPRVLKV